MENQRVVRFSLSRNICPGTMISKFAVLIAKQCLKHLLACQPPQEGRVSTEMQHPHLQTIVQEMQCSAV